MVSYFCYTFIIQSAGERIFKIGQHLAKLQAKWLIVYSTQFALHSCPQKMQNSPDKLNNLCKLCITDKNCYWSLLC